MTLIDSKNDTFMFYNYIIKEIILLIPGKNITLKPENVKNIFISDLYLENLYPIFKLDLILTERLFYTIIEHKKDIQFKLYLQCYYTKNSSTKKSAKYKVINDTFSLILNDDDEFLSKDLDKKEYGKKDNKDKIEANTVSYELFLFKKNIIKNSRTNINTILSNCDVSTAFVYLFKKLKVKNILMEKSDNQKKQDIIIPPLLIADAIKWIDYYYGIYRTGSMIYFGLERGYVLRFGKSSKVFSKNEKEWVNIIVPKQSSGLTDNICQLKKKGNDEKYYVIADPNNFYPTNPSESSSVLQTEDIEIIDTKDGSIADKSDGKNNKKTITRKGENSFLVSTYKAQVKANDVNINVFLKDIDFRIITPNKKYRFLFEDPLLTKKYNGTYFLCSREIAIMKESKYYKVSLICNFRKVVE